MSDLRAADSFWEDVKLSPYFVSYVVCFFNFILALHIYLVRSFSRPASILSHWDPLVDPGFEHLGNLYRYCVSV